MLNSCRSSRLKKILSFGTEDKDRLPGLLLLHQCFQETVTAKKFITNKPQPVHYDALLARYRQRSVGLNFEIVDRERVIELLDYLGTSLRNYARPGEVSWDLPVNEDAQEVTTIGDLQPDLQPESQRIVVTEYDEIRELALNLLDEHCLELKLFLLQYGLELTQTEAAIELDCNQSTIGRQATKLLAKLAQELYSRYHKSSSAVNIPSDVLSQYIKYIDRVCSDYYPELLGAILTEIVVTESNQSQIVALFIDRVTTQWQFKFKPDGMGARKAAEFVSRKQNLPFFFPDKI
ncbi:hypothetical protein [Chamaesiphon polymorphus]|uniref:Uncharacterized protein n=1 Tax=Chamaesiphon polymorphus CCALA 037 TaxID=2107692 RepID=A0A2T1FCJ5_9CYAN|nr:hypothetical protein [Chamaesiphon polymorphus]PSB42706.1 hypothetical protein C7B77_26590 [Chamaesiphon polymorphus CCALA 037]